MSHTINSSVASYHDRNHVLQSSQKHLHWNNMSQTLKVELFETLENENVEIKERLKENTVLI